MLDGDFRVDEAPRKLCKETEFTVLVEGCRV